MLHSMKSRVIPGTPNNGTPLWEASHTIPISLGILDWEWYGNSMGPAYHKGVPLLGVPENQIDEKIPLGGLIRYNCITS